MGTKLQVQITEVAGRKFGFEGRSFGTVVRLSGHWTIEGREVVRFGTTYREICDKCQGSGFLPYHIGVESGRCFPCNASGFLGVFGTGSALELARKLRDRAQAATRREAARAAKVAAREVERAAALEAWTAANGHLAETVAKYSVYLACEHWSLTSGPCYREACETAVWAAEEIYYRELLQLAYTARWRALDGEETARLEELAARQIERDAKRLAAEARTAAKKHLGQVGEKITVTGTLAKSIYFESNFYGGSGSTLYKLTTAEGDTVTWFRTGFHSFDGGETVTLTGTVKALKETEKYGRETQLTRCRIS